MVASPQVLRAELRLQELEELVSPCRVLQRLLQGEAPLLHTLLAGVPTARTGGEERRGEEFHLERRSRNISTSEVLGGRSLLLPGLKVPEGSVVADPGVGGFSGRDKGVVLHELLRVAHQAVGHLGHLHAVSVQLDVQEGDLQQDRKWNSTQ